jgi:hypothetical protein
MWRLHLKNLYCDIHAGFLESILKIFEQIRNLAILIFVIIPN